MKTTIMAGALALAVGLLSVPAMAQMTPAGNGPVAGEGPGGSGAHQSSLGPSKSFLRGRHGYRYRHYHHRRYY